MIKYLFKKVDQFVGITKNERQMVRAGDIKPYLHRCPPLASGIYNVFVEEDDGTLRCISDTVFFDESTGTWDGAGATCQYYITPDAYHQALVQIAESK